MAVLKTLNLEQVKDLFERESILFGRGNGMPASRAKELFGADAVRYALSAGTAGHDYNCWGIGDFQLDYLTISGFQIAATYANVAAIQKQEESNASAN